MADHRESPRDPATPRVSAGRAALAAIAPLVCTLAACGVGVFAVRGDAGDLGQMFREAGVGGMGVAGVALVALPVLSILLFFAARGVRVPVAIFLGVALVPWLAGAAASAAGLAQVMQALAHAEASTRAMLFAAGLSESLSGRLFGGFFSLTLLIGLAFGLAFAALVLEAPARRLALAGVGAFVTSPLLVVAALGGGGLGTLATAAAAVAVGALASSAIGADAHGRSGALATGALVAAALAVLMALGCAQNVDVMALFGALAYAAPSERAQMLTIGLEQIAAPWASWAVLGAGAFGALAHAGLAAWRSPPSLGRMAGALVVVGLALVVSLGESRSAYEAGPTMRDPGVELTRTPGLALLPLRAPNAPDGLPAAIVTPEGLVALDGERLAAWSEPLAPALRALHERASAERAERDRRDPYALERPAEAGGALALAFDARLRGAELIALFDAAAEADLAAIVVVGVQEGFSPEHHAALERAMPMFAAMTSPLREIAVDLSTGPSYREEAIGRYVEARAPTEVRVASDAPERGDGGRFGLAMPATTPATMVFLDDSSDVRAMARAVEAIDEERSVPVIVVRRDEARRRRELEPPNAPDDAEVPAGGVLDRDTIREVIRTHIPIVRGCYERELMRDPSLSGRVTVQITIGPTGGVQAATVTASTMQRPAVDECIARAARSWVFPAPAGGAVVVSYPFVFNSR